MEREMKNRKRIAFIILFILFFQYLSVLFPFLVSRAEGEEALTATDSNGIVWEYTLNEEGQINNIKYVSGDIGETLIIPGILDGKTVVALNKNINSEGKTKSILGDYSGTNIKTIQISEGIKEIGERAFCNLSSITNVNISSTVNNISYLAFSGCDKLNIFYVDEANETFSSILTKNESGTMYILYDNAIYNKDKTELVLCPNARTTFNVPYTVTGFRDYAFYLCGELEKITIMPGVTDFGKNPFYSNGKNLTISCVKESVAETFAKENSINYNYISSIKLTFNDENLYNKIKSAIGNYIIKEYPAIYSFDVSSTITTELTSLDLSDANIEDITGLSDFTELKKLNISNNKIEDFSPITSNLTKLEELDLSYNPINSETLNFGKTKGLKKLNLAYTNLENLNCFSSYNYNNKLYLTDLNLEGNKIDNIAKLNYLKASTFNLNLKNQHYDMKIIKKEIALSSIFSQVKSYNKNVENIYECNNCEINNKKVIVNEDFSYEDTASFTVENGVLEGTVCTIYPEEDITIEFNKEADNLYIETYFNKGTTYSRNAEIEYSIDDGEKVEYTNYIQLPEGKHVIHVYFFGKEIASKDIENIIRIIAIKKDGRIGIYSNSSAEMKYSITGNEDEYYTYNGAFEVDSETDIANIYVKIEGKEARLIPVQSLSNDKIIDWSTEGINSKRFIGRVNGTISIAPFVYDGDDDGFMYSFDRSSWQYGSGRENVKERNAEKLYVTRAKFNNSSNTWENDYSEYYVYYIYDVITSSPEDSIENVIPYSLEDTTFGIIKIEDKYFKYGEYGKYKKYEKSFLDIEENNKSVLIHDEIKLQEIGNNDIVEFTDNLMNTFALKDDGKIYKVVGINTEGFLDLELVDEQANYKSIYGRYAIDSENKVWKYCYNQDENKYMYTKMNYVTREDEKVIKIRICSVNDEDIPVILYEDSTAEIHYNEDNKFTINNVLDIASFENDCFILFPYAVGTIGRGPIIDLEEILEEDEFALSINDNADILTNKERCIKANIDTEEGSVSYNNEQVLEQISSIGNYLYRDKHGKIHYIKEDKVATKKANNISITKNNNELNHNKVVIDVQVPENTYKITKPDGTETQDNDLSYEVFENGRYVFVFTDANGTEYIRVVHVNNIQSRKETKVPQVSIVEDKVKLESDEQIEYSTDFLNWNDYQEVLDYEQGSIIYARIKNTEFECSVIKISKNDQGLWNIENTEKREIQKEILTNSIGNSQEKEIIKYEKDIKDKKDNSNNIFNYIAGIAEDLIYSFSATDGKCAGCVKYEENKSKITYKDINNNVTDINNDENINEDNIDISYSVVANIIKDGGIDYLGNPITELENKYAYIDNSDNLVTNIEVLTKLNEYLGQDIKFTKIVGDGVTFYLLTEEGEVYFISEGDNQTFYYTYKERFNTEPEGADWRDSAPEQVIFKLDLKNIIDIYDSCTALTKDGNIVSLIKDNEEDISAVQELQKQTDKYLLASHIGLKDGKLYDYSVVNEGREVTAGEIISTNEGGYGIYSSADKTITVFDKDEDNSPIIPILAENETYVDVQESNEKVPEFVDIAEYRDSYLLALAYEERLLLDDIYKTVDKNYNTPEKYTRCYALTKNRRFMGLYWGIYNKYRSKYRLFWTNYKL